MSFEHPPQANIVLPLALVEIAKKRGVTPGRLAFVLREADEERGEAYWSDTADLVKFQDLTRRLR